MLNISRCALCCHLEMIGKIINLDVWVLHALVEKKTKGTIDKLKRKVFITNPNPIKHEWQELVRHNSILHMILQLIL